MRTVKLRARSRIRRGKSWLTELRRTAGEMVAVQGRERLCQRPDDIGSRSVFVTELR